MTTRKEGIPFEDWEYLIHHVEVADGGEEQVHHCLLYDHIANFFEQQHLLIQDGKATLDGKEVPDGLFHVVIGLEPTQEVAWTDEDAIGNGIQPKKMVSGMTAEQKAKEW